MEASEGAKLSVFHIGFHHLPSSSVRRHGLSITSSKSIWAASPFRRYQTDERYWYWLNR